MTNSTGVASPFSSVVRGSDRGYPPPSPSTVGRLATISPPWATDGRRIYVAGDDVTTNELFGAFPGIEPYEPAAVMASRAR